MKKLLFGLVATTLFSVSGFANTPTLENENEITKENTTTEAKKEVVVCTVGCSIELGDGISISATAGNWFMSCEKAYLRCLDKLSDINAVTAP